jgi:hypothetical protein
MQKFGQRIKHFSQERKVEGKQFMLNANGQQSPNAQFSEFSDPPSPNRRTSVDVRMGQNLSWLNLTDDSKTFGKKSMQLSILKVFPE